MDWVPAIRRRHHTVRRNDEIFRLRKIRKDKILVWWTSFAGDTRTGAAISAPIAAPTLAFQSAVLNATNSTETISASLENIIAPS